MKVMPNPLRLPSTLKATITGRSVWQHLEKPITGLLLTFALIVSAEGFPSLTAQGAEVPSHLSSQLPDGVEAVPTPVMPNGVYLYGQSPQAEQIGSTYVVFEVNRDRVVGAFYMPASSFDCFQGQLQPNQMQLTIAASYDQESYPYAVAVQHNGSLADTQGGAIAATTIPGYHPLTEVSESDQTILATCKQQLLNR